MSVWALLEELERQNVQLRVAGENLEYEGPREVMTLELLERMKAYKADLIAICAKTETVAEEGRKPGEGMRMRATTADPEACKLSAAGWEPKEYCDKVIWKRPDNGFYYSQEMASHLLGTEISNAKCKSGADGRG